MPKVGSIKHEVVVDVKRYLYAVEKECEDCGEWLYHSEDYDLEDGRIAHAISYFLTLEDALRVVDDCSNGHYRIIKVCVEMDSFNPEEMEFCERFHKERGGEIVSGCHNQA